MGDAATESPSAEEWLRARVGRVPETSLGFFRAGVAFYNKGMHSLAAECLDRSVAMDPQNFNAFAVLARARLALNDREAAVAALRESVKLGGSSDWQLLVELTNGAEGKAPAQSRGESASGEGAGGAVPVPESSD